MLPAAFTLQDTGYANPNQYIVGHTNGDISSTPLVGGDYSADELNWRFELMNDGSNTYKLRNIKHNSCVFPSGGSFGIYSDDSAASIFTVAIDPNNSSQVTIQLALGGPPFAGFAYCKSNGVYILGTPLG